MATAACSVVCLSKYVVNLGVFVFLLNLSDCADFHLAAKTGRVSQEQFRCRYRLSDQLAALLAIRRLGGILGKSRLGTMIHAVMLYAVKSN